MMPRRFMKKFHSRVTNEEKIHFTDERTKKLIREFMGTDDDDVWDVPHHTCTFWQLYVTTA